MKRIETTPEEDRIAEVFADAFRQVLTSVRPTAGLSAFESLEQDGVDDLAIIDAAKAGNDQAKDALKTYKEFLYCRAEDAAINYVKKLRERNKR